jgi:periplasmic divalent cation tolerance protein
MPTVLVTAPPDDADDIARTLVEDRLAACVNRVACDSVYRWDGAVHDDPEVILLAKTTDDACDDLLARVRDLHPYDVPCIERFDETDVLPTYADWRDEVVDGDRQTGRQ